MREGTVGFHNHISLVSFENGGLSVKSIYIIEQSTMDGQQDVPSEFWLFGYGFVHFVNTLLERYSSNSSSQFLDLEATSSFWYICDIIRYRIMEADFEALDQRVPGYVEGYVRRFWQVQFLSSAYNRLSYSWLTQNCLGKVIGNIQFYSRLALILKVRTTEELPRPLDE